MISPAVPAAKQMKRRSINPEAWHAVVILGHAIEYLADEFVDEGGSFTANRGQVDAIQLLMALNREIYLACPEVPTFREWLRSKLHRGTGEPAQSGQLASRLSHGKI
jgi:hypothetical protein